MNRKDGHERREQYRTGTWTGECRVVCVYRIVSEASDSQLDVLLPKPRLTKKGKDKQSQRPTSVPSFLPPVVLDNSKVFFPLLNPPFFYSTFRLISFSLDDRLVHLLSHRRPFPKHQWRLVAKRFKSIPSRQYSWRHSNHPQETHGLRRLCQSSQPSPP